MKLDLSSWQKSKGFTNQQASDYFDVSLSTYKTWKRSEPPRAVQLYLARCFDIREAEVRERAGVVD